MAHTTLASTDRALEKIGDFVAVQDYSCENLRAEGITCTFCAGDVRKPEDCAAAVATAVDSFGHLNVLINGAAGMCT